MDTDKIKPSTGIDDRVPLKDVVPLSEPYSLYLYPTNRCNFRCRYCVHALPHEKIFAEYGMDNVDMSFATFKNAIDGLEGMSAPLKTMIFVGQGEPLLNRDLAKMISYAAEKKAAARTEIITNASLLTPETADMLLASGLDVLRVSLQGMSAKAYKNICGIDLDYARLLEHLRYFYDKRGNCRLYVKVVDEALEAVEETLFYDTFSNISDRMFIEKIKPVYDGVTYNERPDNVTIDRYGNIHAPRLVCPLPFFMITVWPDGSVAPCETIYKPVTLGNVNAQNLLDLWRGEKLRRFWEEQLSNGKSSFPRCQKCCAPDDVSHPLDVLDDARDALLKKIGSIESMYIA